MEADSKERNVDDECAACILCLATTLYAHEESEFLLKMKEKV